MSYVVLVIVVLLLADANGANDNFKVVASVFGTHLRHRILVGPDGWAGDHRHRPGLDRDSSHGGPVAFLLTRMI